MNSFWRAAMRPAYSVFTNRLIIGCENRIHVRVPDLPVALPFRSRLSITRPGPTTETVIDTELQGNTASEHTLSYAFTLTVRRRYEVSVAVDPPAGYVDAHPADNQYTWVFVNGAPELRRHSDGPT